MLDLIYNQLLIEREWFLVDGSTDDKTDTKIRIYISGVFILKVTFYGEKVTGLSLVKRGQK